MTTPETSAPITQAGKPKLYALLVGVGAYERVRPLRGPVGDASALMQYLLRLDDFDPHLLLLSDQEASKPAIIAGFQTHLAQAQQADTALFYFAGHGAQEAADPALWPTESDGKLECIVCHDAGTVSSWDFLLADKELRYLIGQVSATGAHVVTIFDCCHSGDNTRAAGLLGESLAGQDVRERRLTQSHPRRPYEGFFFHQALPLGQLQQQGPSAALPMGAHIQMAACESDESAVEASGEGIFTKNLLAVLEAAHGQVSYRDLHNRVRQYMRFGYEQRPRVYVPERPDVAEQTSLLSQGFLNQSIDESTLSASVTYNAQEGWLLDVGAIHGVGQSDQPIYLHDGVNKTTYPVRIGRIGADYTVLTVPDDVKAVLDKTVVYRATVKGLLTEPIRLHLVNHGGPTNELPDLLRRLTTRPESTQSETFFVPENDEANAHYTLHVRNGLYYVTRPADENRPLIRPIQADDPLAFKVLMQYLRQLSQWQYLKELRNPAAEAPALTVELTPEGATPMVLHEAHSAPIPITFLERNGRWTTTLTIRLTNSANQPLYCTALYLSRDFMAYPGFLPTNYRLEPGQSVTLGLADAKALTGRQASFRLKLEEVIRQYNWPVATEHIKLLVTVSPLSETTLAFLSLDALPSPPVLSDRQKPTENRAGFEIDTDELEVLPEWSTQTITLDLVNPLYNKVQADELNQMLEPPADATYEDIMADFAIGLYYEPDTSSSGQPQLKLRDDIQVITPDEGQRGLWNDLKLAVANTVAHRVQNRRYTQNLIRYPDRVRIVAKGDSWFHYPFLLRDIIDYLSGVYSVFSVPASGHTLDDYLKNSQFLEALAQVRPAYFMLSVGSSDLLGETFGQYILDTPNTTLSGPQRYLSDTFAAKILDVGKLYGRIFRLVQQGYPQVQVLVHGYDYVVPTHETTRSGTEGRLGKILLKKGVRDQAEREAVAHYIIDSLNDQLREVVKAYPMVTYLDLRGTIRRTERLADYWYDELHPNDKGFLSLSSKFVDHINRRKNNADPTVTLPLEETPAQSPANRWTDEFLRSKRKLGDPVADQVITTLLADNQKGEVDQIFQMLVRNRHFPNPAFDVLPESVKNVVENYFVQTQQVPAFAEPFKLMVAADVFKHHGPKILLILLCKSLPTCYTCWRGAKVLHRTGRLRVHDGSLDSFSRRLMETAQFVVDMMTTNNFEHDGTAIVATQKVRLMHAAIRHFAQERNWDAETYGVPINQEDLVGTLLSFGVVIVDGLQQLGVTLTPEQRAAYLHLWRVVGKMMGIDDDLLSEDEEECRALMNAILEQQAGPSIEGTELTEACIDLMNTRLIAGPLKRLSPFFVRFFVGDRYADMLRVPAANADDSLIMDAVKWLDRSVQGIHDRNLLVAAIGRALSNGLIRRILDYTNAAKSEQFYMPSALTDTWESAEPDFRIPPLEHINEVIFYLDKVARYFRAHNNPIGYFCAVYKLVTQRVAEGIRLGVFAHPVEMERIDVGFANRYFEAINHYFDGEPASAPWQVSFDAAQTLVTTDQHIFAAANAHISFDLPIVVADAYRGKDIEEFKGDFGKMNELFDDMYDQMNEDIGSVFRPFGHAVEHFAEKLKAVEQAAMKKGRDIAWAKSLQLHQAKTEAERTQLIAALETEAASMGRKISKPPFLLRKPLELVAKKEFGTAAHKVDVMLRTAMLPVVV